MARQSPYVNTPEVGRQRQGSLRPSYKPLQTTLALFTHTLHPAPILLNKSDNLMTFQYLLLHLRKNN